MEEIFKAFVQQEKWTSEKQIEILLEFIEEQDKNDALVDFLEKYVKDCSELKR